MRYSWLLMGLMVGCGVEPEDSVFTSGPANTTTGTSGDASTSSTGQSSSAEQDGTTGDASTGPATSDGFKLDVSVNLDITAGGEDGCEKIDFLFVIDNSNSMSDEQQLLIDAFPTFVDTIVQTLPQATDFHVGVTKTDVFGFDDDPAPDPTNPCPYVLGGLLTHATEVGGRSGVGMDCAFSSGALYMTNTPSLADEFECVAFVGTGGNTGERQAESTLAALSPGYAAAGGCAEGFLRSDALLVLVVITDEDDDWSEPDADLATNAQAWFDGVVAAKGGVETNAVVLLISGGSPKWPTCGPLDFNTQTGADDSPKLTAWAQMFTNHVLGNVCEPGYAAYLGQAISTIETACADFEPAG